MIKQDCKFTQTLDISDQKCLVNLIILIVSKLCTQTKFYESITVPDVIFIDDLYIFPLIYTRDIYYQATSVILHNITAF